MDFNYSVALERRIELLHAERLQLKADPEFQRRLPEIGAASGFSEDGITKLLKGDRGWRAVVERALSLGMTFYWSGPACKAVERLAGQMPDWAITPQALPSRHGFFWFEEPLRAAACDWHGPVMAIGWSSVAVKSTGKRPTWSIPPEDLEPEMPDLRWSPFFIYWGLLNDIRERSPRVPLDEIGSMLWVFGDSCEGTLRRLPDGGTPSRQSELRYLAAALASLEQGTWAIEAMEVDPLTRAALEKTGARRLEPVVSVIQGRRQR